jgi:hypothetical protein
MELSYAKNLQKNAKISAGIISNKPGQGGFNFTEPNTFSAHQTFLCAASA